MEVVIQPDAAAIAALAADAVEDLVRRRPDAVLGLATGSTPMPLYEELIRRHRSGGTSYASVTTFNLDEYIGLPSGSEQTYLRTIQRNLTSQLDIRPDAVHGPDPDEGRLATAGDRYERGIAAAGGIDLQILGIGSDGHLAFNEPGSSLASRTRIKTLTARTRSDNQRFFRPMDEVPTHVLTQGLGTILQARHLIMIATGEAKADAVATAVEGPVSSSCPASVIQMHPHATVLIDEAAAASLTRSTYYREVFSAKPDWQGL